MIGGSIWGLPGVLCGPLISTIVIVYMWKPYFLFSKGLKKSVLHYIKEFCLHLIAILIAYLIAELTCEKVFNQVLLSMSWKDWILGALLFTSLMTVFSIILFYSLSFGFRSFIYRFIKIRIMKQDEIPQMSIIVPVYKTEKYLRRCIQSILSQTFSNFELILIDDGSPDNSGIICDEYAKKDKRVKVFHQKNGGVSNARNKGIEHAQGTWISFIDSDDYVENLIMNI